jgi:hypothetical protein
MKIQVAPKLKQKLTSSNKSPTGNLITKKIESRNCQLQRFSKDSKALSAYLAELSSNVPTKHLQEMLHLPIGSSHTMPIR